jgi:transcriptional regulator with XRE-family HTH domain
MKRVKPVSFPADPFVHEVGVLAQAIKAARTQSGLSLADAAMLCNVALQTLVDIEAGSQGVSLGKFLQVADALGVSLFTVPASKRERARKQLVMLLQDES